MNRFCLISLMLLMACEAAPQSDLGVTEQTETNILVDVNDGSYTHSKTTDVVDGEARMNALLTALTYKKLSFTENCSIKNTVSYTHLTLPTKA